MTDLTKLIELQAAATPGPWKVRQIRGYTDDMLETESDSNWDGKGQHGHHIAEFCYAGGHKEQKFSDDARFCAAARNFDFAALVEYVESLQNDIGKLVIQRESLRDALTQLLDDPGGDNTEKRARQALKQEG